MNNSSHSSCVLCVRRTSQNTKNRNTFCIGKTINNQHRILYKIVHLSRLFWILFDVRRWRNQWRFFFRPLVWLYKIIRSLTTSPQKSINGIWLYDLVKVWSASHYTVRGCYYIFRRRRVFAYCYEFIMQSSSEYYVQHSDITVHSSHPGYLDQKQIWLRLSSENVPTFSNNFYISMFLILVRSNCCWRQIYQWRKQ